MDTTEHLNFVTKIVSAFLGNNEISPEAIPGLMESVHETLQKCVVPNGAVTTVSTAPTPPPDVDINHTVFPDYIICLEDGMKFQTMKRHLSVLGMSPDDYRRKWGLPTDYPMVCASYSAKRSHLATEAKLGIKPPEVVEPKKIRKTAVQKPKAKIADKAQKRK